jgi:hypothetical protein
MPPPYAGTFVTSLSSSTRHRRVSLSKRDSDSSSPLRRGNVSVSCDVARASGTPPHAVEKAPTPRGRFPSAVPRRSASSCAAALLFAAISTNVPTLLLMRALALGAIRGQHLRLFHHVRHKIHHRTLQLKEGPVAVLLISACVLVARFGFVLSCLPAATFQWPFSVMEDSDRFKAYKPVRVLRHREHGRHPSPPDIAGSKSIRQAHPSLSHFTVRSHPAHAAQNTLA